MKKALFVTDLYCDVQGRNYYEEDLFLTNELKRHFNIIISHPTQAIEFVDDVDFVILRNTGPIVNYKKEYDFFTKTVLKKGINTFNSFDGKADMKGKDYMLELTKENFPVIPTIDNVENIEKLGKLKNYIVKPKNGADSVGIKILEKKEIKHKDISGNIIQPFLDFEYEISFYYINKNFQYALYAPEKSKRWKLDSFIPNEKDLNFANKFIEWNNITRGITRVDACSLKDGSLLLIELEDLNPYLSLDSIDKKTKKKFVANLVKALKEI
tara:strand:+ start:74 stop:880 length:807 start_codon:yes stop_codon:yes gene_type:complete